MPASYPLLNTLPITTIVGLEPVPSPNSTVCVIVYELVFRIVTLNDLLQGKLVNSYTPSELNRVGEIVPCSPTKDPPTDTPAGILPSGSLASWKPLLLLSRYTLPKTLASQTFTGVTDELLTIDDELEAKDELDAIDDELGLAEDEDNTGISQ